jgi:hypothetical protein
MCVVLVRAALQGSFSITLRVLGEAKQLVPNK